MRFLIINADYAEFVHTLYAGHPGLEHASYDEQLRVRTASMFSLSDFYSSNLRKLGHEARDVFINVEPLQKRWAEEHDIGYSDNIRWRFRLRKGIVPWAWRERNYDWVYEILEAQIKAYRPDVVYSIAIEMIDSEFLRRLTGYYRLAVGQHAAPVPARDFSGYDLMVSSLPNLVDRFRNDGMKSELLRLGFEPRVLEKLTDREKRYDIVFVGGVRAHHRRGVEVLERLCREFDVRIWGYGLETLPANSPVRASHMGTAWGVEMFQILRDAKIAVNRHIDVAEDYANNMRLYEATGVGSLLLTDYKQNISDLFEPGKELVTYRDAAECVELAGYYLAHEDQRETIARAGQERTCRDHTYEQRMRELVDIIREHL